MENNSQYNSDNADKARFTFGLLGIIILAAILAGLFFIQIPTESKDLVNIGLGFIAGYVGSVFSYYFGSSEGSDKKTSLLGQQSQQQATGKADDPVHIEPQAPEDDINISKL